MKKINICSFADNTTVYACAKNLDSICSKLEIETNATSKWLKNNEMVANPSELQLMFLGILSNDQIQSNYLVSHWAEILILNGTKKIFVAKQITKQKLLSV